MNLHKEIETTLGYLEAVKDEDVRYELIHHLEELLSSVRACNNKEVGTPLTVEELNSEVWFTEDLSVDFREALLAKGLDVFGDWSFSFTTISQQVFQSTQSHAIYERNMSSIQKVRKKSTYKMVSSIG